MVEQQNKEILDLNTSFSRLCLGVTHNNLENDIFKLFLRKQYSNLTGPEKIRIILIHADDEVIGWHKTTFGEEKVENIDYEKWKSKLFKNFRDEVSMLDFLQSRQKEEESVTDFFKRMESNGKLQWKSFKKRLLVN